MCDVGATRLESSTMRDDSTKHAAGETRGSETTADAVEQRVVAFAEQLGRIVGTVQAKAEGWMDRDALNAQISSVRDSAAELLEHLGGGTSAGAAGNGGAKARRSAPRGGTGAATNRAKQPARSAAASGRAQPRGPEKKAGGAAARKASPGRSGDVVDAPGKRHRQPMANDTMPKRNDSRLARLKVANANANRGRGRG